MIFKSFDFLRHDRKFWTIITLMLVFHAGLAFSTARKLSVTHDEYWHLPVGLLSWKTSRFDYDVINPPLIRMWGAVPLLFTKATIKEMPVADDASAYGDAFLYANLEDHHRYFLMGRCMILLLSVAAGLLMAIWARQLFGKKAAYLATLLWAFSPNLLAHASLMTHDLAVTGFFLATLFAAWHFAQTPTWRWTVITGIILALALLSKFTALLLPPLLIVYWMIVRFRNSKIDQTHTTRNMLTKWGVLIIVSLFVLNLGYLFTGTGDSLSDYNFQSSELKNLSALPAWIQSIPLPLPHDYVAGFDRLRFFMEQEHPSYLNFSWALDGWREYYVMGLLVKLPHPTQFLWLIAAISVALSFRKSASHLLRVQLLLAIPFLSLLVIASLSSNQLGLRYILPVFPCLFLFIAQIAESINFKENRQFSIVLVLLMSCVPLAVRHHPGHLSYFNELAGGPIGGRAHLIDSNLDWGQDLWAVREYVRQHNIEDVGLLYFGSVPPASQGIKYHLPNTYPEVGLFLVSVNYVHGQPHTIRQPNGEVYVADLDFFRHFRFFEPTAHLGTSIDVYNLTDKDIEIFRQEFRQSRNQNNPHGSSE